MLITRSDDGYFAGAAMIHWRQMDFTITSLISRWRGTGLTFPVAGFFQTVYCLLAVRGGSPAISSGVRGRSVSRRGHLKLMPHGLAGRFPLPGLIAMIGKDELQGVGEIASASSSVSPSEKTSGNSSKVLVNPPSGAGSQTAVSCNEGDGIDIIW